MILGRVVGTVTSTVKHPTYRGRALMVVQPVSAGGNPEGNTVLAIDDAQAGVGDTVLVLSEGNGIRQILGEPVLPIQKLIVGIVDAVEGAR